jgi:hypothetical protein
MIHPGDPVNAFVGDMSFHRFATIIAGSCTAVSILLCFSVSFMHLLTYRNPSEQRQIARIVLTPAIISFFDFLAVAIYPASGFVKPLGEYYDAIALVCLYLLFITYATPEGRRGSPRDTYKQLPDLYLQHSYQGIKKNELSQYYVRPHFSTQISRAQLTLVTSSAHGSSSSRSSLCDSQP